MQILIKSTLFQSIMGVLFFVFWAQVSAAEKPMYVAIIVDDLGSSLDRGKRLIEMPAQLTYSFLPHTPYAKTLANDAHQSGKEVMLHLPMQPMSEKDMGPGGLQENMNHQDFILTVHRALKSIPFAVGVNNHMGSLLTRSSDKMHWLMRELKAEGDLYFVDSRTHAGTVAAKMAGRNELLNASRDIFLDHVIEKEAIDFQFKRLIRRVKNKGFALAIGHPHMLTINALYFWIDKMNQLGITIVSVGDYIQLLEGDKKLWQASLSLSHKAAKN